MLEETVYWNKASFISFICTELQAADKFIPAQSVLFTSFYFESGNIQGRGHLPVIDVDRKTILKLFLNKSKIKV